jgi:hypothetical protein
MFMTQDVALDRSLSGSGWTAGVDASVAMLKAFLQSSAGQAIFAKWGRKAP